MKNSKRVLWISIATIIIMIILSIFIIKNNNSASNSLKDEKITITISVFDKQDESIYTQNVESDKKYLADVVKDIKELKVITEPSQYGEYITSMMGIEQGDDYYWSYYIDGDYATVGISSCEIQDGKNYEFKIEKFNY